MTIPTGTSPEGDKGPAVAVSPRSGHVADAIRLGRLERPRVEMRILSLDQMIEPGHHVRLLWR